jgi:hypothetical protein
MLSTVPALLIESAVQTVVLLAAFWIMIKIQKLDYHFPGLLGTAALVAALDRILDAVLGHFLGSYFSSSISAPIVVIVGMMCIAKVTWADRVDVIFTVGVGYALWFVMNLWLLGALMGDLRPDLHPDAGAVNATEPDHAPIVAPTNRAAKKAAASSPAVKAANNAAKDLAVKGLIRNGSKSVLMLGVGTKIYTLYLHEKATVQTREGSRFMQFEDADTNSVTVLVDETPVKLTVP